MPNCGSPNCAHGAGDGPQAESHCASDASMQVSIFAETHREDGMDLCSACVLVVCGSVASGSLSDDAGGSRLDIQSKGAGLDNA